MQVGICNIPLLPLRLEPSERSEMVTQILFGELFEVLESQSDWSKIRNVSDNYSGWCSTKMLQIIPFSDFEVLRNMSPVFTSALITPCLLNGEGVPRMSLPLGSRIYDFKTGTNSFSVYKSSNFNSVIPEKECWCTDSIHLRLSMENSSESVLNTALLFLNAPYLWGGKSIFGIDCSGLIQLIFSINGLLLPRDAKDQVLCGDYVENLSLARTGDLAFFSNLKGVITHVGILLDNSRILHSSGCVHIDRIDNQGIFSDKQGFYTHSLSCLRRISSAF